MANNRRGFTIIELLVVVSIIGILATIALPKFSATKQRASMASMVSDLRNLVAAQEGFYSAHRDYAGSFGAVEVAGTGGNGVMVFTPSPNNTIEIEHHDGANGVGWSAVVTNSAITDPQIDECGAFVGHPSYSPNAAVVREGAPACY